MWNGKFYVIHIYNHNNKKKVCNTRNKKNLKEKERILNCEAPRSFSQKNSAQVD
jgi:hypothetical protein